MAIIAGTEFMYHASKYAIVGLSEEALQKLLLLTGVGITLLLPGFAATSAVATSRALEPDDSDASAKPDPKTEQAWETLQELLSTLGLPAENVADKFVEAVKQNRFYLHTDRIMIDPVKSRTEALLTAMSSETDHDRAVYAAIAAHIGTAR